MAGAKVPLTFRIFKGDQLIREEKLSLSVIKLGKVPSAHLKLDDETVSRMHAIIEVNGPGDVSIIDLGSTKGTFVNGQKVNKAKLQSGDTIVVGETKIELAIGEGEVSEDMGEKTKVQAPAPQAAPPPPNPMAQTMQAPSAPPPPSAPSFAPPPAAHAIKPPPGMGPALYGTPAAAPGGFSTALAGEADDVGGARSVQAAAMLGGAVGAACLVAFSFAFYTSVDNAAYNRGALDYWTSKRHKPAFSYRPRTISGI